VAPELVSFALPSFCLARAVFSSRLIRLNRSEELRGRRVLARGCRAPRRAVRLGWWRSADLAGVYRDGNGSQLLLPGVIFPLWNSTQLVVSYVHGELLISNNCVTKTIQRIEWTLFLGYGLLGTVTFLLIDCLGAAVFLHAYLDNV